MPNIHEIKRDFDKKKKEWKQSLKVKQENKILVKFDYELDSRGPENYYVDSNSIKETPQEMDPELSK